MSIRDVQSLQARSTVVPVTSQAQFRGSVVPERFNSVSQVSQNPIVPQELNSFTQIGASPQQPRISFDTSG